MLQSQDNEQQIKQRLETHLIKHHTASKLTMNTSNNPQIQMTEQNNLNKSCLTAEEWFNQSMINLERMNKDETFRQEVASRATNWVKQTLPHIQAKLDKKAEQRANFNRQHEEFIKTL